MAANAAMTSSSNRRVLPQWIRSLHIWLSMIGFGATLLFAVTGFTLNHVEWFEKAEPVVTTSQGALPLPLLGGDVDRLAVAEELRASHRLRGRVAAFEVRGDRCEVTFRNAGYAAVAAVDRASGGYTLTEERRGVMAILDDLHRGKHCGPWWSTLVDVAAVLLTLMSVTGLWLMLYLTKRLKTGMILGFIGGATFAMSYVFTVR